MADKTPKEYFDRFKNRKQGVRPGGVCDILCVREQRTQWRPDSACHAGLLNISGKDVKAVYSSLWSTTAGDYEAAKAYWLFILDPLMSPFRRALKDVEIILDNEGEPIAFGVQNNGCPNQIIGALMIASRQSYEYPNTVRAFKKFREAGFTGQEAYFLCTLFQVGSNGVLTSQVNAGHQTHNGNIGADFKKLRDAAPKNVNEAWTWNNGQYAYNPTVKIWEPDGIAANPGWDYKHPQYVRDLLKDRKGLYKGLFPNHFKHEVGGGTINFNPNQVINMPVEDACKILLGSDREKW